jgi:transposase
MASLQARKVKGHTYWYIVESRRVNGKPRPVVLAYLGKAEQLLQRLQQPLAGSLVLRSYSHGAVAALLELVRRLDLVQLLNQHVPISPSGHKQLRDGLTVGASLILRVLERICSPCSNRAFSDWASSTSLDYLLRISTAKLDSQHFWDQMDVIPVEAIAAIEQNVVKHLLDIERVELDTLLLDATNFFTFIDTTNPHCPIAQRGKNKQGRNNLRQVGVLLVVTRRDVLPLFHETYAGNQPDSKVFDSAIGRVLARLKAIGCDLDKVTLVFDRGNNSKANLSADKLKLHYVGALVPTQHRKLTQQACSFLAKQPTDAEQPCCYRVKTKVWGRERTVVGYRSTELYEGQLRGLEKEIQKRLLKLEQLNGKLPKPQTPKRTLEELETEVKRLVKGPLLAGLIRWQIHAQEDNWRIEYARDEEAVEKTKERLGLRLLISDRHDWTNEQIIEAYHNQARVEYGFKNMKNPYHIGLRPQFHWTEQKVRVHVLCCVLGLTLVSLLYRQARQAGYPKTTYDSLLDKLNGIRLASVIASPDGKHTPQVHYQLEQTDPLADLLLDAFAIRDFHLSRPAPGGVVVYE